MLLATIMHLIGEMSAIPILSQVAFCGGAHWLNTEFGRIFIVSGGYRSDIVSVVRNSDAQLY